MITLEELPKHLETLTVSDWNRLFSLLPELESTTVFGDCILPENGLRI